MNEISDQVQAKLKQIEADFESRIPRLPKFEQVLEKSSGVGYLLSLSNADAVLVEQAEETVLRYKNKIEQVLFSHCEQQITHKELLQHIMDSLSDELATCVLPNYDMQYNANNAFLRKDVTLPKRLEYLGLYPSLYAPNTLAYKDEVMNDAARIKFHLAEPGIGKTNYLLASACERISVFCIAAKRSALPPPMVDECFLKMYSLLPSYASNDMVFSIKAEQLILQYHISKLLLMKLLKTKFPSCSPKDILTFQCNGSQMLALRIFELIYKLTDGCKREVLHTIACSLIQELKENKYEICFLCDEATAITSLIPTYINLHYKHKPFLSAMTEVTCSLPYDYIEFAGTKLSVDTLAIVASHVGKNSMRTKVYYIGLLSLLDAKSFLSMHLNLSGCEQFFEQHENSLKGARYRLLTNVMQQLITVPNLPETDKLTTLCKIFTIQSEWFHKDLVLQLKAKYSTLDASTKQEFERALMAILMISFNENACLLLAKDFELMHLGLVPFVTIDPSRDVTYRYASIKETMAVDACFTFLQQIDAPIGEYMTQYYKDILSQIVSVRGTATAAKGEIVEHIWASCLLSSDFQNKPLSKTKLLEKYNEQYPQWLSNVQFKFSGRMYASKSKHDDVNVLSKILQGTAENTGSIWFPSKAMGPDVIIPIKWESQLFLIIISSKFYTRNVGWKEVAANYRASLPQFWYAENRARQPKAENTQNPRSETVLQRLYSTAKHKKQRKLMLELLCKNNHLGTLFLNITYPYPSNFVPTRMVHVSPNTVEVQITAENMELLASLSVMELLSYISFVK